MKLYTGVFTKTTLKACFADAVKNKATFIGVRVSTKGYRGDDIMIFRFEDFDKKLAYYDNNFNDDLTLKSSPDEVRISGFAYGNTFGQLSRLL